MKYKSAKTQSISGTAAVKDVLFREPVAVSMGIAFADSTVQAVVFAVVGKFNQSAYIDVMPVMDVAFLPGEGE